MWVPRLALASILICAAGCEAPPDDESVGATSDALTKVCGAGPTVRGLDVSYYDGTIDFEKVKASGQRFIIARTNDGTFVDPKFVTYFKAAKAAGLLVGAYMFYRVGTEHSNPGAQTKIMLDKLKAAGWDPESDLPPTLDIENATFSTNVAKATMLKEMRAVLATLETAAGRKPLIYTNATWEDKVGLTDMGDYPLWAAQYMNNGSSASNCPKIANTGAKTWTIWQHCKGEEGAGQCPADVPGVPVRPDQNVFNGTEAELLAFAKGGSPMPRSEGSDPSSGTSPGGTPSDEGDDDTPGASDERDAIESTPAAGSPSASAARGDADGGCSSAPGRARGAWGIALVAALAVLAERRREARSRPSRVNRT
jgi:lysozyme